MKDVRAAMLLYAVTDSRWARDEADFERQVEQAIQGGATCVQLREKTLAREAFLERAKRIRTLCERYNVLFIVNDEVDIAKAVGADGVHVGQSDESAREAREKLGPDAVIGVSAKTVEQALAAEAAGADYLGVGAMFSTGTKTDARTISRETFRAIREAVDLPIVAIGGIDESNIEELAGTGADGVAAVSAIFAAKDPKRAACGLKELARKALIEKRV